ncbi:MAG: nickel pincer cofactor biosynthesis protein LarB [Methermicoccaceae archaeon]
MDERWLIDTLRAFRRGELSEDELLNLFRGFPYLDLGFAKIDTHRGLRRGVEEVIFCKEKTQEQIKEIARALSDNKGNLIFTHVDANLFKVIKEELIDAKYYEQAKIAAAVRRPIAPTRQGITIITGGTSDISVAEEAAVIAELLGNDVERIYDIGVAGFHRLIPYIDRLRSSNVIIAVAGMEGALVTVVAGITPCPVIAVPTSVGYGANMEGFSTMLAMLSSCVPGVGVVNIDNGFGAGVLAHMINNLAYKENTHD